MAVLIPENLMEGVENLDLPPKDLTFLMYFLARESQGNPCYLQVLQTRLNRPKAFEHLAKTIIEDAKKDGNDEVARKATAAIYNAFLKGGKLPERHKLNLVDLDDNWDEKKNASFDAISFLLALSSLSEINQGLVVAELAAAARFTAGIRTVTMVPWKSCFTVANVALMGVSMTFQTFWNMYRWWRGEISGRWCLKASIDNLLATGAGVGVGLGMAIAVGSLVNPIVGGIAAAGGAVLATVVVNNLSGWLSCRLFNVPKTEAMDNAYRYMGVNHLASNDEINKAYRKKALKCHPDKNKGEGSVVEWHKLQFTMATIKVARGEVDNAGTTLHLTG